jgi:hypothetical protein
MEMHDGCCLFVDDEIVIVLDQHPSQQRLAMFIAHCPLNKSSTIALP